MANFLELLLLGLRQFAGGPGPPENNLVRFGLPAILWGVLLGIAWSRRRARVLPRENLLVWGFGLGLARELYMFAQVMERVIGPAQHLESAFHQPVEHALSMAAIPPDKSRLDTNVGLAILFSFLLGLTFLGIGLMEDSRSEILGLLWGSILFVQKKSVIAITAIALLVGLFS